MQPTPPSNHFSLADRTLPKGTNGKQLQLYECLSAMNTANEMLKRNQQELRQQLQYHKAQNHQLKKELFSLSELTQRSKHEFQRQLVQMETQKARLALALQEKYQEARLLADRLLREEMKHRSTQEQMERLRSEISSLNDHLSRINEYCLQVNSRDDSAELHRLREQLAELRAQNERLQLNMLAMADNHRVMGQADSKIWESRLQLQREGGRRIVEEIRQTMLQERTENQKLTQQLQSRVDALEITNQELQALLQQQHIYKTPLKNGQSHQGRPSGDAIAQAELRQQNSQLREQLDQLTKRFEQRIEDFSGYYERLSSQRKRSPQAKVAQLQFEQLLSRMQHEQRLYQEKIMELAAELATSRQHLCDLAKQHSLLRRKLYEREIQLRLLSN